jgi:hypothetical protein
MWTFVTWKTHFYLYYCAREPLTKIPSKYITFDDKTAVGFGNGARTKKINFMSSAIKRKNNAQDQEISIRSLYMVKKEYIGKSHFFLLLFYY